MPSVELPDIPRTQSVTLPASSSGLVVVDMQNDFAHPEGTLFGEDSRRIIPIIAGLLSRTRAAGVPIVYTQDWHGAHDPEFAIWGKHARADTWGAQIVEELAPEPGDIRVRKLRYDAFYGTPLDHMLRVRGVRQLAIVGTVANICVLHTASSAALRFYEVVVPEDGVAALTPFDKHAALRQITILYNGRVTRAGELRFA